MYNHYANPNSTLPMPKPEGMPVSLWAPEALRLRWRFVGTAPDIDPFRPPGALYRAEWTSTTFDLRPDQRSAIATPKDGFAMWNKAARLYVQITSDSQASGVIPGVNTQGLTVTAVDWSNPTTNFSGRGAPGEGITGGAGLQKTEPRDVTSQFSALALSASSILVGFAPPGSSLGGGDGYPVRYWRLQLTFDCFLPLPLPFPDPLPTPPSFILQPSAY